MHPILLWKLFRNDVRGLVGASHKMPLDGLSWAEVFQNLPFETGWMISPLSVYLGNKKNNNNSLYFNLSSKWIPANAWVDWSSSMTKNYLAAHPMAPTARVSFHDPPNNNSSCVSSDYYVVDTRYKRMNRPYVFFLISAIFIIKFDVETFLCTIYLSYTDQVFKS